MLVVHNQAEFTKKAVGRVTFSCHQGKELDAVLQKAIETGEGQTSNHVFLKVKTKKAIWFLNLLLPGVLK